MKIYNTQTKQKEEFKPIEQDKVRMYVCGPTVYNLIHIGNARPYIVFDTVRRYLESVGYDVNFVQNFTDVDDKIIKKANEEGKTTDELVTYYIEETLTDAAHLNVKPATVHPRVTNEMDEIIEMIETLIKKGFAYEVEGTVYFDTEAFSDYGKLSKKVLDELEAGARIQVADQKKNPMDFVLWKPKKEGEPYWGSPWSDGRPGWHIECSAMAKKYLGETIDIHAGGEDLVFPHHENEVAQSEAANGKTFSNYWMHNSFLNIDNRKMSKSLGNFKTLREVGEAYGYDVVRFFMLSAHYRSPLNFSGELMEAAKNGLDRIKNCITSLEFAKGHASTEALTDEEKALLLELPKYEEKFHEA
ncbi:MAG: cysteine--tRNA ligase, partial [Cellulosilyticaceae bacterium]